MSVEYTLSIIKPDATSRNISGKINTIIENAGLKIVAQKMLRLNKEQAEEFYIEHRERPFFNDLVSYMISGPVMIQVLKGENAVLKNREIMGATNPAEAKPGTIRKEFALSIEANSVHGSDNQFTAAREVAFFFVKDDVVE